MKNKNKESIIKLQISIEYFWIVNIRLSFNFISFMIFISHRWKKLEQDFIMFIHLKNGTINCIIYRIEKNMFKLTRGTTEVFIEFFDANFFGDSWSQKSTCRGVYQ